MQLINIEDIQVGDEIIISGNSKLKYLKVLRAPVWKNNNGCWGFTTNSEGVRIYQGNIPVYKSLRCSTRQDTKKYKTLTGTEYEHKEYIYEPDVSKHNVKINVDLYGKDIILAYREEK